MTTTPPRPGIVLGGPATETECLTEDIVSTEAAAHRVGVATDQFKTWARRRGLKPAVRVRVGRSTRAGWSLAAVLDAQSARR
ncbi:hypothetical protein G7075_00065 [Phycicoccus sp. HDW14]|uniref:hypothetical protein n=1 Tax=Phycicoccus sp. HDW14 TaxID=2714941 RepID=UPI00140C5E14|nr:hypothetical protein [Phycicoccus sp. HDW14]QIM19891.1 hypothetical protein G7075_00065 [Phycicoccus sp. HDW14]